MTVPTRNFDPKTDMFQQLICIPVKLQIFTHTILTIIGYYPFFPYNKLLSMFVSLIISVVNEEKFRKLQEFLDVMTYFVPNFDCYYTFSIDVIMIKVWCDRVQQIS